MEEPTTALCSYEERIGDPAPAAVIALPDPEKTRPVVESVA